MYTVLVFVVEIGFLDVGDTSLKVLAQVEDTPAAEVRQLDLFREILSHLV